MLLRLHWDGVKYSVTADGGWEDGSLKVNSTKTVDKHVPNKSKLTAGPLKQGEEVEARGRSVILTPQCHFIGRCGAFTAAPYSSSSSCCRTSCQGSS